MRFFCGEKAQTSLQGYKNGMLMLMVELINTRFQLILPVANHNVTKNLTGHRMHVAGPQIYQMN